MKYLSKLYFLFGLSVYFLSPVAYSQSLPNYSGAMSPSIKKMYHLPVKMRDGVKLTTDVYLPKAEGKFPTLLVRDMYSNGSNTLRQSYANFATSNGYAFVFQSVRGRYDSEGDWYPYFQEINDGDDTLSWIADQAWSNGKVGMFGSSYLASVQWLAALSNNPALVAIAPAMSPGNYYRDVAYPGGVFSLLSRARWGIALAGSRTIMSYPIDWSTSIEHLPIETLASSLGFDIPHFQDWLEHPIYDDYWKPLNLEARAKEMSVPALNIGGWYDVFVRSTIGSYMSMTENALTKRARNGQRMIIGPWPHGWNKSTKTGEVDFGEEALIDVETILLEWFGYWLKDGEELGEYPISIFVMGENTWRNEKTWPLDRTDYRSFYLLEDGAISEEPSDKKTPSLSYTYDPANPVPTLGGNIMDQKLRGPFEQKPLDERKDILRFVSDAFAEATEITGPISAEIYASSSAVDTDFTAKLMVVKADGSAVNLVDGVIRTRYQDGFEKAQLKTPGKIYKYTIDLWATSYLLAEGDRLRVDISSSNFPRLARNLNNGEVFAKSNKINVAEQTIYMNGEYRSKIILPIIPR